jgi:hypothetical protein
LDPIIFTGIVSGRPKSQQSIVEIEPRIRTQSLPSIFFQFGRRKVGKAEVNRRLGRIRRRWENKIKMDLQEIG